MAYNDDRIRLCDVHTHILPGIDDGCKTTGDSLAVLQICAKHGIHRLFCTPHYYSQMPVNEFLAKRQRAYSELAQYSTDDMPKIRLGAEVAYTRELVHLQGLEKLSLGGTEYILLEMPQVRWTEKIINDVATMKYSLGLEPVIAHIDRYIDEQPAASIKMLEETGVLFQMNTEYILDKATKKKAKKLIKSGKIALLGSDCHDLRRRVENLDSAAKAIADMKLADELRKICSFANSVFDASRNPNVVVIKRPQRV